MTSYETYVFLLCLIVFLMLTALSVICITIITRLSVRLIQAGAEDSNIIEEERKKQEQKNKKHIGLCHGIGCAFSILICIAFVAVFGISIYNQATENRFYEDVPTYRVVLSGSMAKAHENNTYLKENNITDRLQVFDLAAFYKVTSPEELKLYDIIVYEIKGEMICHRIVDIRINESGYEFILQGDAVKAPDKSPVHFDQIRAVYRGERIPHVGSFVMFLRSPAGWLCMFLVVVGMIASPIVDSKIARERRARLSSVSVNKQEVAIND
ncbi:MAG: hypothetical protein IJF14_05950 [Clostridia bacterium]|nr:hypothetical protein [Clostridia bacterium]